MPKSVILANISGKMVITAKNIRYTHFSLALTTPY
jgi:hypothetical protein